MTLTRHHTLIASAPYYSHQEERLSGLSLHEVLVTLFLFITAPINAHLMAKAALHSGLPSLTPPPQLENERQAAGQD